jgi:hypothetical protein
MCNNASTMYTRCELFHIVLSSMVPANLTDGYHITYTPIASDIATRDNGCANFT